MIKLHTIQRYFDHVDDQGRCPMIDALASLWGADPGSGRMLHASSNFTATFTTGGKRMILRFVPIVERAEDAIQAELAYVRHLASRGIHVSLPQPSRRGAFVERVGSPIGHLNATAWIRLEGHCRDEPEGADPEMLRIWGRSLGRLHAAAEGYATPGRPDLNSLVEAAVERLPSMNILARKAAALLMDRMSRWERNPGTYGLLHFDFSIDNLIFGEGEPGIIDFDDSAYGWFGADIAFALRHCFNDRISGVDPNDPRLEHFLSGYREVRPVPHDTLERLPHFLAVNHLHHWANISASLENIAGSDAPAWVLRLREKLQRMCEGFQEELVRYCEGN